MLLLDDDDELSESPAKEESMLGSHLGLNGLASIDAALARSAQNRWLKAARVVADAISSSGLDLADENLVRIHARRLMALVDSGVLDSRGNLRKPRWSEVRLRTGSSAPPNTPFQPA